VLQRELNKASFNRRIIHA